MAYNDGKIHNDFYEDSENLEKIALEFSEGNPLLASTLLTLWKNGIKTHGCCNGHENNPTSYLSIEIDNNSRNIINNMCENLSGFDGVVVHFNYFVKENVDIFSIDMPVSIRDEVLTFLSNNINMTLNDEQNNRVLYSKFLMDIAHKKSIDLQYIVASNGEQAFSFGPPAFIDDFPSVDEAIESLKQENSFELSTYLCTDESLEEFIGLIYKSSPFNKNVQSRK